MTKIRVLVVDDAVVVRKMVTDVIGADPALEVAGTAANGKIALAKIPQLNPDVVTLDVEMPEMDGLQTLAAIRKLYPTLPVIMFSTLTARGASTTIDALTLGANDYVTKPANVGSVTEALQCLRAQLVPKLKLWDSVLGWEIQASSPTELPRGSRGFRTGFIQIAGAWEDAIVCISSEVLIRRAAATMFDMNPDTLTIELLHDALGELTNMVGGNLKALLPGPSFLCLPAVVEGADYSVCVPATQCVVEVAFSCHEQPFTVKLLAGGLALGENGRVNRLPAALDGIVPQSAKIVEKRIQAAE